MSDRSKPFSGRGELLRASVGGLFLGAGFAWYIAALSDRLSPAAALAAAAGTLLAAALFALRCGGDDETEPGAFRFWCGLALAVTLALWPAPRRTAPESPRPRAGLGSALPAALLPERGARRILLISDADSRLPGFWREMPGVDRIDTLPPTRNPAGPRGDCDLVFVETPPPMSPAARRRWFRTLFLRCAPGGVLAVPENSAPDLPEPLPKFHLPGGGGFVFCGRTADGRAGRLDGKLQRLQARSDTEILLPPGMYRALYDDASPWTPPSPPAVPWGRLAAAALLWLALRLALYRRGMAHGSRAVAEASGALTLIVLTAAETLAETPGGLPPTAALAAFGAALLPFGWRDARVERGFAFLAALFPFAALGIWPAAAALPAALATAATVRRVRGERKFGMAAAAARTAAGILLGVLLYLFLGKSPTAALAMALMLRLAWVCR